MICVVTADRTGRGCVEGVGGGLVTNDPGSLLTAFQIEVAQLFFSLPASDGFYWLGEGPCWRKA
jgi:hypothetical protein